MANVVYYGTRDELRHLLRSVPSIFAGSSPDPLGVAKGLQLRLGVALLSKVQEAFKVKSRGGLGEDGIKWAPLDRKTIIARRRSAADKRFVTVSARLSNVTPAQRRQIARAIEAEVRHRAGVLSRRFGMSFASAAAAARGLARAHVEERFRQGLQLRGNAVWGTGNPQNLRFIGDILAAREVDILRDTGELFRSFSPGVEDKPSEADGQIFETPPGRVIVGTNKKPWHHRGVQGKFPARPFWRPDGTLPQPWWDALIAVAKRGIVRAVVLLVQRRAA